MRTTGRQRPVNPLSRYLGLLLMAAVLGACGMLAVLGSVGGVSSLGGTAMAVFALGVVAYPWLANGIKIRS